MKSSLAAPLLTAVMLAAPACAAPAEPQPAEHRLFLTGVGRFAVLADLATVSRERDRARMRSLQVTEADFEAGGQSYWGGWSWWDFDCAALTADRLDFASVREGGAEGPATPDTAPAYPADPGGDAAELLAVACDPAPSGAPDADTVAAAVRIGRAALAE